MHANMRQSCRVHNFTASSSKSSIINNHVQYMYVCSLHSTKCITAGRKCEQECGWERTLAHSIFCTYSNTLSDPEYKKPVWIALSIFKHCSLRGAINYESDGSSDQNGPTWLNTCWNNGWIMKLIPSPASHLDAWLKSMCPYERSCQSVVQNWLDTWCVCGLSHWFLKDLLSLWVSRPDTLVSVSYKPTTMESDYGIILLIGSECTN